MKTVICLFVLALTHLFSSTTPQYQISSTGDLSFFLTNSAEFHVLHKDRLVFQKWDIGDSIHLMSLNVGFYVSPPIRTQHNQLVLSPVLFVNNLTKNNEQILVWLEQPPTGPQPGTFLISQIDLNNHTITLSDSSIWLYPGNIQHKVQFWLVGDTVMIGLNNPISNTPTYGAILFNTSQLSIAQAIQQ